MSGRAPFRPLVLLRRAQLRDLPGAGDLHRVADTRCRRAGRAAAILPELRSAVRALLRLGRRPSYAFGPLRRQHYPAMRSSGAAVLDGLTIIGRPSTVRANRSAGMG